MYVPKKERFQLGELEFIWDWNKAQLNAKKHGVSFEEAATSWLDPRAIERFDKEHAGPEDRWIRLGMSLRGALVVCWWTVRVSRGKEVLRIIGARRAAKSERSLYEKENP
ncbi:MAG: BrnT family toxin [Planctomycetes bacterium]|nr:BrnT family toxin [Planctomycetota bacterium]